MASRIASPLRCLSTEMPAATDDDHDRPDPREPAGQLAVEPVALHAELVHRDGDDPLEEGQSSVTHTAAPSGCRTAAGRVRYAAPAAPAIADTAMMMSAATIAGRPPVRKSISVGETFRNTARIRSTPNVSTKTTNAPKTASGDGAGRDPGHGGAWVRLSSTTSPATTFGRGGTQPGDERRDNRMSQRERDLVTDQITGR